MANIVMAWNTTDAGGPDRWSNRRQVIPPELIGRLRPPGWRASTCGVCFASRLTAMLTKSCLRGKCIDNWHQWMKPTTV